MLAFFLIFIHSEFHVPIFVHVYKLVCIEGQDKKKEDGNLNVIPKDKRLASLLARMPRMCPPSNTLSPNPNHQYCLHNPFFDSFAFVWPTTDLVNFKSSTACLLNHFSVEKPKIVFGSYASQFITKRKTNRETEITE